MKEQKYDYQMLTAYLLGTLPAADAERFDELSFTDDDFAFALQSAENDLTDNYVRGELGGETLREFQTHYLASPLRRQKVEFAEALKIHTDKKFAPVKEIVARAGAQPKRPFGQTVADFFTKPRVSLQWGFALGALALIFFGGWLWRENLRLQTEISQSNLHREEILRREFELARREKQLENEIANRQTASADAEKELAQIREERARLEEQLKKQTQEKQRLADRQKFAEQQRVARNGSPVSVPHGGIASFVLAPSLRGGSRIQTVSIPPHSAGIAAALELETDEYAAYRAVLRDSSGSRVLWRSGKLKSKSGGGGARLNINFSAALLKSDVYSIEVTGIAADGAEEIIGDYSFRAAR